MLTALHLASALILLALIVTFIRVLPDLIDIGMENLGKRRKPISIGAMLIWVFAIFAIVVPWTH